MYRKVNEMRFLNAGFLDSCRVMHLYHDLEVNNIIANSFSEYDFHSSLAT